MIAGQYDPRYLDLLRALGHAFAWAWTLDQAVVGVQIGYSNLQFRQQLRDTLPNFHARRL